MTDLSKNIKKQEDGYTDFVLEMIVNYNGKKYHMKDDLGAFYNDKGILPLQKWEYSVNALKTCFRPQLFKLGVLEQPTRD